MLFIQSASIQKWLQYFAIPLYGLTKKETLRFLKLYHQCIFAPVINGLVLITVFGLAYGKMPSADSAVTLVQFIAPGIVMMNTIQSASSHTSSSLIMAKMVGFLYDYLMPPLSANVILLSLCISAILRSLTVAICFVAVLKLFYTVSIAKIGFTLVVLIVGATLSALIGVMAGIFLKTFDQVAAISMYIIMPLSLLSGTFYSIKVLPKFFYTINNFNPFYHMINCMRFGFLGISDTCPMYGLVIITGLTIILYLANLYSINKFFSEQ